LKSLAGAGGIEPCNNPLPHKDFSIPGRTFDSIFDSKAKALVAMTDDKAAYIEANGWKASVVPEPSITARARSTSCAFEGPPLTRMALSSVPLLKTGNPPESPQVGSPIAITRAVSGIMVALWLSRQPEWLGLQPRRPRPSVRAPKGLD
jgi:hypothetical protein